MLCLGNSILHCGRNPFCDDSPVNTNKQWSQPWLPSGGFSSIHSPSTVSPCFEQGPTGRPQNHTNLGTGETLVSLSAEKRCTCVTGRLSGQPVISPSEPPTHAYPTPKKRENCPKTSGHRFPKTLQHRGNMGTNSKKVDGDPSKPAKNVQNPLKPNKQIGL